MERRATFDVSVIVPVFDDPDGLDRCLLSLSQQTSDLGRLQVVVVDNGSSLPITIGKSLPFAVKVIRCTKPGSYAARNAGAAVASGNALAFIDADCVADPEWLRYGLERLAEEGGRSVVGGEVLFEDVKVRNGVALYQYATGFQQHLNITRHRFSATANLFCTRARRSVRWFLPEPVGALALRRAVEVANQAPSACNRQSVRFMLFEEAADARRLGSLAPGASGMWTNFTALAVLVADFSAYAHERDRHAVYVDGGLKAMTFMYALESLGLASCPLNWPDNSKLDRRIASELRLQSFERVVLMIAVGYADPSGLVPFSHKVAADHS